MKIGRMNQMWENLLLFLVCILVSQMSFFHFKLLIVIMFGDFFVVFFLSLQYKFIYLTNLRHFPNDKLLERFWGRNEYFCL